MKIIIQGKAKEGKTTVAIELKHFLEERFGATVLYTGHEETADELKQRFGPTEVRDEVVAGIKGRGLAVEICEQAPMLPPDTPKPDKEWKNTH